MLGVIRSTDILVADVSSVTLDFLYLRPGAPILLTDRRSNRAALLAESPLAEAAYVIDSTSIAALTSDLPVVASDDQRAQARIDYAATTTSTSSPQVRARTVFGPNSGAPWTNTTPLCGH